MSLQPTTLPDLELIDTLDFEPDLTCEIVSCAELHGSVLPAELVISVSCSGCPRESRLLACTPCVEYFRTPGRVLQCILCNQSRPAVDVVRVLGTVK